MALQLNTTEAWKGFFTNAGINENTAGSYAEKAIEQELDENDIPHLLEDASYLNTLGITLLGHRIKIRKHIKFTADSIAQDGNSHTYSPPNENQHGKIKAPAIPPPNGISLSVPSKSAFRKFVNDWDIYKKIAAIEPAHYNYHIYKLCDEKLQTRLQQLSEVTESPYISMSERDLLNNIQEIVLEQSNPRVHRFQFSKIYRFSGESMKDYYNRLQDKCLDCEFHCKHCEKDISEQCIVDQFINGLKDERIQLDLFAAPESSLSAIVQRATRLESAASDFTVVQTETLHDETVSKISDYRKLKKGAYAVSSRYGSRRPTTSRCTGCGELAHTRSRKEECSAWNDSCSYCKKPHHTSKVCFNRIKEEGKAKGSINAIHDTGGNAGNTFNYSSSTDYLSSVVDDHVYGLSDFRRSENDLYGDITPIKNDEECKTICKVKLFPDTGASLDIAGPAHQELLGITDLNLQTSPKTVRVASGQIYPCYGCIPVTISVRGNTIQTELHFCKVITVFYLSKCSLIKLNILPPTFPVPMNIQLLPLSSISSDHTGGAHATIKNKHTHTGKKSLSTHEAHNTTPTSTSQSIPVNTLPHYGLPKRPYKIPFTPTENNISKLSDSLLQAFQHTVFNKSGIFPTMTGPPMKIHLKDEAVPKAILKPIPVPINMKDDVYESLQNDVEAGIIEPWPIGQPIKWCAQMIAIRKKSGKIRRVVDFQYLNSQCFRELHTVPSPFQLACQVPAQHYKTTLDAVDGYHAIPLDKESVEYTAFVTEWGVYRYLRGMQGFFSTGDAYTRRYDEVVHDFPRLKKIVDDSLLYDTDIESAFWHTWNYLYLCAQNGIVLNADKFKFCQKEVQFAGLLLTKDGVAPTDEILDAIKNFPVPIDITGARSWFGLVNQVAWADTLSEKMEVFRDLVKKNSKFHWNPQLQQLFEESKERIIEAVKMGIKTYNPLLPTCIQCDWSQTGVGYLLLQKHCKCSLENIPTCCASGWKLIYAGSRFTTSPESRYSATEGEALAVSWALQHARFFTLGCPNLVVVTDHKPLLGIFRNRDIGSIPNPRIQRFKEKTLRFKFSIHHCPGKWQRGADAVSRYPTSHIVSLLQPTKRDTDEVNQLEELMETSLVAAIHKVNQSSSTSNIPSPEGVVSIEALRQAGLNDDEYKMLISTLKKGFPSTRHQTKPEIRQYFSVRDRLSVKDGIIFLDKRLLIPKMFRKAVIKTLHSAHQGGSGMTSRARTCIYWPRMEQEILNHRANCLSCHTNAPSLTQEPLKLTPSPEWPYQHISADYFKFQCHGYLVIVDNYSGWLNIIHIPPGKETSQRLVDICRDMFMERGVPEILQSDGGPQFMAHKFQDFLHHWGVQHRLSSAGYAQSNGRAELAVKTAKRLIRENVAPNGTLHNDNIAKAVLQYRNTPLPYINLSPAQILYHRQLRDFLPCPPSRFKLNEHWLRQAQLREESLRERNEKLATRYNRSVKVHQPLQMGASVLIQNNSSTSKRRWDRSGTVVEVLPNRQYMIKLNGSGRLTRQNRKFIKQIPHGLVSNTIWTFPINDNITTDSSPSVPPTTTTLPGRTTASTDNTQCTHSQTSGIAQGLVPQTPSNLPRAITRLMPYNNPGLCEAPLNYSRRSSPWGGGINE